MNYDKLREDSIVIEHVKKQADSCGSKSKENDDWIICSLCETKARKGSHEEWLCCYNPDRGIDICSDCCDTLLHCE